MGKESWELPRRKCENLSIEDADAIFFPPRGGRHFRAESYCSTCPLVRNCLIEAIELRLEGFFAGTTENDRRKMEKFHNLKPIETFLPPEPDPDVRPVYLKVFTSEDPRAWMDQVEPTAEELFITEIAI